MFADIFRESYLCLVALLPSTLIEQVALAGILVGGIGTVASTHMISNILCLVVTFIWGAVLCLVNKAEFLAFLLPVVYIGAVLILFLFVVMMVDFRLSQSHEKHVKATCRNALWLSACVAGGVGAMWPFLGGAWPSDMLMDTTSKLSDNNVLEIGKVLYTQYVVHFQWGAFILFVAMVSALWLLGLNEDVPSRSNTPLRPKMRASTHVTYVDVASRSGWQG